MVILRCSSRFFTEPPLKPRVSTRSRAEFFFGSNPHSNGDPFSRSSLIFFEINVASIMMTDDNMIVIIAVVIIIIIIIYLVSHKFLDWKSSILSCI